VFVEVEALRLCANLAEQPSAGERLCTHQFAGNTASFWNFLRKHVPKAQGETFKGSIISYDAMNGTTIPCKDDKIVTGHPTGVE
jgi:hypothetical protein